LLAARGNFSLQKGKRVLQFKRAHSTGTQATLRKDENGWHVIIDFMKVNCNPITIIGYLAPTLDRAKELADKEASKYGHVCHRSCKQWMQL